MENEFRRHIVGYLIAVVGTVAVVLIRLALSDLMGQVGPMFLFIAAVVGAAYFGGLKAGLLASAMGVVAGAYFFLEPRGQFGPIHYSYQLYLVLFTVVCVLISWLYESLHRAHRRLTLDAAQEHVAKQDALTWKARYEAASQASGSILYDCNRLTREVVYGGNCEQILGYTAEQLNGDISKWIALVHPEDRDFFRQQVEQSHAGGGAYHATYRMIHKEGQTVWMRDDGYFAPSPGQEQPTNIIGLVKDMTKQRQSVREVNRLSRRLDSLLDNTPLAVIEWDANLKITRWSGEAQKTFGWAADEVVGRTIRDIPLIHEEDWPKVQVELAGLCDPVDKFVVFRYRARTKAGQVVDCEWYNSVLHDQDDQIVAILSLVLDVSQRVRAERDLRDSEDRFRQLTNAMPQVVWIADASGTILHHNSRIEGIAAAIAGPDGKWKWDQVVHPDDRARTHQCWQEAVGQQSTYQCEHRILMADGSYRWHLSRALPVPTGPNQAVRWYATATDIHDLKVSQEALRESEERFQAFMDNDPSTAFLKDEQGRFVFVNRQLERMFDRPVSQWIGKTDNDLFPPEVAERFRRDDHIVLESGQTVEFEEVLQSELGSDHYLTIKFPVHTENQRMLGGISLKITERKLAEFRLQAERERVQLVADAVPALISYVDAQARYQLVNQAYERWFGHPSQQFLNRPMEEVLGEEAWGNISQQVAEVLSGKPVAYEAEIPYQDGGTRWVTATYIPDLGEDGTVRGFVAHVNDITARRQAEEELKYQRSLLQAITNNAQTSIFLIDEDGHVLFTNPAAEEMTGYSQAEMAGNVLHRFVHPTHHPDGRPYLIDECPVRIGVSQQPSLRNQEDLFVHRDGHFYPVRWNARSVLRDGQAAATVIEVWDITKEKRAEQELQEARRYLETIIETAPNLIVVTKPGGEIVLFNRACEVLTGYTWHEVVGQEGCELFVPSGDREELQGHLADSSRSSLSSPFESPLITKKGQRRLIEWRFSRLQPRGEEGETLLLSTGIDVTERRHLEDTLRDQAERLAETDRRKDEFLATLAHELRNPLAPIRMGLELMRISPADRSTLEETRDMMERQTKQLITLVDDLLDVSRVTRGRLELRKSRVLLAEIMQIAVESAQPAIEEARHTLSVDLPDQLIYLDADPNRLAQVVSNLLNNAAKYTPAGGRISVSASPQGREVVLSVKDNGIGIPVEMQRKIFDMFAQIDRPIEHGATGLGIGLTLVKSLVEMHGGRIEVASEGTHQGSEFKVWLPISSGISQQADPSDSAAEPLAMQAPLRVLVVDDNKAAAEMLTLVIETLGHEVQTAFDGQHALDLAEEFLPDVVVMDIGMPKMNGYEAAQAMRQEPWGESITLIALTGWGQEDDKRRTKEAGFDHHLVKPAEPAELQRLLRLAQEQAKELPPGV